MRKDVQMIVLDGSAPAASLHLFPLGFLREPLEMAEKADIILVNKGEPDGRVKGLIADLPVFHVRYRPQHLCRLKRPRDGRLQVCAGKKVLAFSGLGDNSSFFGLLREIGADVVEALEFPDHHWYSLSDLKRMESFQDVEMMVTTEKDAVKIEGMEAAEIFFYLSIEAEIEDQEALLELV